MADKGRSLRLIRKSEKEENWENAKNFLDSENCYFILSDFSFDKEGRRLSKTILITWIPPQASVFDKMLYSTSKLFLKETFEGINFEETFESIQEVSFDNLRENIIKKLKIR